MYKLYSHGLQILDDHPGDKTVATTMALSLITLAQTANASVQMY